MKKHLLLSSLLLAGLPHPARARDILENVEDIADLDISELLGVVESASNMPEARATAPAAVFVMDREEIQARSARNIPELLWSVPGLQVVYIAPGTTLVSLRGLGGLQGNNLVVLVDGVQVNSPVDGTVDWEHIAVSVEDLDRIEVVRGPVSAIYGSDAYTGVIQLITLRQRTEGARVAGSVSGGIDGQLEGATRAYASAGFQKGIVSLEGTGRIGEDSTWAGAVGEDEVASVRAAAGRIGARLESGSVEANARVDLATSTRDWMDHLILNPSPIHGDEVTAFLGGRMRAYGVLRELKLETVHRVLRLELPNGVEPLGFTYAGTNARVGNYTLGAGLRPLEWMSVGLGFETGWEQVSAPYLHPEESGVMRGRYGGSGSVRMELGPKLVLSGNARGDISSRLPDLTWSERASLTYVGKDFTLRGSVASAFREPSYVELGARLIDPESNLILLEGAPMFRPPRVQSAEVGLIAVPGGGVTIEPVVFVQEARDLAVLDFEPLVKKTFRNDNDRVPVAGLELAVRWKATPSATLFLRGHHLEWLVERTDRSATVGVEEQNPDTEVWAGAEGTWKDFKAHVQAGYVSPRTFAAQAGMPPQLLFWEIPALTPLEGSLHWAAIDDLPIDLWTRASWHPQETNEFPVLAAGVPDISILIGLELRRAAD